MMRTDVFMITALLLLAQTVTTRNYLSSSHLYPPYKPLFQNLSELIEDLMQGWSRRGDECSQTLVSNIQASIRQDAGGVSVQGLQPT